MTRRSNAVQQHTSISFRSGKRVGAIPCLSSGQQSTVPFGVVLCLREQDPEPSNYSKQGRDKDNWEKGSELNQKITTLSDQNIFTEYMVVSCII